MTTDIITIHPRSVDFPYWRKKVSEIRDSFERIIVVMSQQANSIDVTQTVKCMADVMVLDNMVFSGTRDWRDIATNMALDKSRADRVLFLEQDILFDNETVIGALSQNLPVVFREGNRIHPAFLLVDRESIEKTSKDFSVDPVHGDHFGKFTSELSDKSNYVDLKDIGRFLHLAGTTQNYSVFLEHPEQLHRPDRFYTYNNFTMGYKIPYDPQFTQIMDLVRKTTPLGLIGDPQVASFL